LIHGSAHPIMQSSAVRLFQRIEIEMIKLVALILTLSSTAVVAREAPFSAWNGGAKGSSFRQAIVVKAPEIDPASAASALTLLLGGVMVLRSRRATKR
jgi:hypothetical protein